MRSCTNKSKEGHRKGHTWKGRGPLRYCEFCGLRPSTGKIGPIDEMASANARLAAEHPELYKTRSGSGRSRKYRRQNPNEYMEGSKVTFKPIHDMLRNKE